MRTTTIDLGEVGAGPPGEPRPRWRSVIWARGRRLRRGVDRFRSRRWPATTTAAVALALLLTSAAGPPAAVEPLWTLSVGSGSGVVGAGHLYRLVTAGGDAEVVARRLADGAVAWRTRAATTDGALRLHDGTLVLVDGGGRGLIGLDPATGRTRWQVPGGAPSSMVGGWIVMHRTGSVPSSGRWGREWMTAVHARTGRVGGAVPLPADYVSARLWEAPDGTPYVFTLGCDAWLVKHDLWAGGEVARVRTHWEPSGEEACDEQGPVYRGQDSNVGDNGSIVVSEAGATGPVQTEYDAHTLARLWSVAPRWRVEDCGPVICLSDGRRLRGVEPHTGAVRWEQRCGPAPLQCQVGSSVHAGWLWVPLSPPEGSGAEDRLRRWVVNPVTGQRLADATPWQVAVEPAASGRTLLLRIEDGEFHDQETDRTRTWWARSGPDLTGLRPLFEVTAQWCQPAYPYLACGDRGEISIWWVGEGTP
jgi:hypothetical protein